MLTLDYTFKLFISLSCFSLSKGYYLITFFYFFYNINAYSYRLYN